MIKKMLFVLVLVGMLISAGGCTTMAINALTYGGAVILATTILTSDLEEPEYEEGRVWFEEPNEPSINNQ